MMQCTISLCADGVKGMGTFLLMAGLATPVAEPAGQSYAFPATHLELAWLVPVEATGRLELVWGDAPPEATARLYTVRFVYEGDEPAPGLAIVQAMPAGAAYVAGSASGPGTAVSCSPDGGHSFRAESGPQGEDGSATSACTHLRWELAGPIAPGLTGMVSFHAVARGSPAAGGL